MKTMTAERKAQLGQFFTPAAIAEMMASQMVCDNPVVSILDAGAGIGTLFAALVSKLCQRENRPARIIVTGYEIDERLLDALDQTMEQCRAKCCTVGIEFEGHIIHADFIRSAVEILDNDLFSSKTTLSFNCAILNPPYRKIQSSSETRALLRRIGIETSNLYTGFLAAAMKLLEPGGEMVAITPRSFCNGPYFKNFRQQFLNDMSLRHIHVFESREQAFREDNVLQENIIFDAVKGLSPPAMVTITASTGPGDEKTTLRHVPYSQVVSPKDPQLFIHIVPEDSGYETARQMALFQTTLTELGLNVSTGRVVDFRARDFLRPQPEPGTAPLIYPTHFAQGWIQWPKTATKKPNAIAVTKSTETLFVVNQHYVLVKRFSAKEEKKRIVAALHDPVQTPGTVIGIENHLNYFHSNGEGLDPIIARGLWVFLNSTVVDAYFRQFSGHTQVNATDLRAIKYPTKSQLRKLGSWAESEMPSQSEIDRLIAQECRG